MTESHAHIQTITLGTLHLASGVREINVADPPGVHDMRRRFGSNSEEFWSYVAGLSKSDQARFVDGSLTNFHEVSHYHQSLSTVVGTEIVSRATWEIGHRARWVHAAINHEADAVKSLREEHAQRAYYLEVLAEGAVCPGCRSEFYAEHRKFMIVDEINQLPLEFSSYQDLYFLYYNDPASLNPIGGVDLMEAESFALEQMLRYAFFERHGDRIAVYGSPQYSWRYQFVETVLSDILGDNQTLLTHLVRAVPRLALNAAPSIGYDLSLRWPTLKLLRILASIKDFRTSQLRGDDILPRLEQVLYSRHGYPTSAECMNRLKERALADLDSALDTRFQEAWRDYRRIQLPLLDLDWLSSIGSGHYGSDWSLLPKPPLTIS